MKTKTLYNEQYVECEYDIYFNDVLKLIDTCTENEKHQILNQLNANDIIVCNTLEDEEKLKIFKNKSVEIIILSKDGSYSDIIKPEFEIENDFILQLINNPVSIESSVSFLSRDDANAR